MKDLISLLLVCLSAALVRVGAQTQTIIDIAGETVVVDVTTNALGIPTTLTLETLTEEEEETTSTTSTSTSTTTTAINQGPVGQPGTTQTGATAYTYTTTDAVGNTEVLTDIYTPTSHIASFSTLTFAGTIVDYSDWTSAVGTNTAASVDVASDALRLFERKELWAGAMALAAGTLGGAWLVLL